MPMTRVALIVKNAKTAVPAGRANNATADAATTTLNAPIATAASDAVNAPIATTAVMLTTTLSTAEIVTAVTTAVNAPTVITRMFYVLAPSPSIHPRDSSATRHAATYHLNWKLPGLTTVTRMR
jgi:hypothetical protein